MVDREDVTQGITRRFQTTTRECYTCARGVQKRRPRKKTSKITWGYPIEAHQSEGPENAVEYVYYVPVCVTTKSVSLTTRHACCNRCAPKNSPFVVSRATYYGHGQKMRVDERDSVPLKQNTRCHTLWGLHRNTAGFTKVVKVLHPP